MDRIFIEITRHNNDVDLYRFEHPDQLVRAIEFLFHQVTAPDVKNWTMKTTNRFSVTKYDLIED